MSDILGYARVSTHTQDLDAKRIASKKEAQSRCSRILSVMVCVVRLDCLGRSLRELLPERQPSSSAWAARPSTENYVKGT